MRALVVVLCSVLLLGCKTSKDLETSAVQKKALAEMMANKSYEITSKWAFPTNGTVILANSNLFPDMNNAASINLMSITNFIKKEGDKITVELPFFGVRQMGGGYNSDTGIAFSGEPSEYKMTYNEKKQRYKVFFRIRKKQETFNVTVYLFSNLTSDVRVVSTHRSPISYRGSIKEI